MYSIDIHCPGRLQQSYPQINYWSPNTGFILNQPNMLSTCPHPLTNAPLKMTGIYHILPHVIINEDGSLGGVEPTLVTEFARHFGAHIEVAQPVAEWWDEMYWTEPQEPQGIYEVGFRKGTRYSIPFPILALHLL